MIRSLNQDRPLIGYYEYTDETIQAFFEDTDKIEVAGLILEYTLIVGITEDYTLTYYCGMWVKLDVALVSNNQDDWTYSIKSTALKVDMVITTKSNNYIKIIIDLSPFRSQQKLLGSGIANYGELITDVDQYNVSSTYTYYLGLQIFELIPKVSIDKYVEPTFNLIHTTNVPIGFSSQPEFNNYNSTTSDIRIHLWLNDIIVVNDDSDILQTYLAIQRYILYNVAIELYTIVMNQYLSYSLFLREEARAMTETDPGNMIINLDTRVYDLEQQVARMPIYEAYSRTLDIDPDYYCARHALISIPRRERIFEETRRTHQNHPIYYQIRAQVWLADDTITWETVQNDMSTVEFELYDDGEILISLEAQVEMKPINYYEDAAYQPSNSQFDLWAFDQDYQNEYRFGIEKVGARVYSATESVIPSSQPSLLNSFGLPVNTYNISFNVDGISVIMKNLHSPPINVKGSVIGNTTIGDTTVAHATNNVQTLVKTSKSKLSYGLFLPLTHQFQYQTRILSQLRYPLEPADDAYIPLHAEIVDEGWVSSMKFLNSNLTAQIVYDGDISFPYIYTTVTLNPQDVTDFIDGQLDFITDSSQVNRYYDKTGQPTSQIGAFLQSILGEFLINFSFDWARLPGDVGEILSRDLDVTELQRNIAQILADLEAITLRQDSLEKRIEDLEEAVKKLQEKDDGQKWWMTLLEVVVSTLLPIILPGIGIALAGALVMMMKVLGPVLRALTTKIYAISKMSKALLKNNRRGTRLPDKAIAESEMITSALVKKNMDSGRMTKKFADIRAQEKGKSLKKTSKGEKHLENIDPAEAIDFDYFIKSGGKNVDDVVTSKNLPFKNVPNNEPITGTVQFIAQPLSVIPTAISRPLAHFSYKVSDLTGTKRSAITTLNAYHAKMTVLTYRNVDGKLVGRKTLLGVSERSTSRKTELVGCELGGYSMDYNVVGKTVDGKYIHKARTWQECGYDADDVKKMYLNATGLKKAEISTEGQWRTLDELLNHMPPHSRVLKTLNVTDHSKLHVLESMAIKNPHIGRYNLITNNCQTFTTQMEEYLRAGILPKVLSVAARDKWAKDRMEYLNSNLLNLHDRSMIPTMLF